MSINETKPNYYWLLSAKVFYLDSEGASKIAEVSSIVITKKNHVSMNTLNESKNATIQQATETRDIAAADVLDMTIVAISSLGRMTKEEFESTPANTAATTLKTRKRDGYDIN